MLARYLPLFVAGAVVCTTAPPKASFRLQDVTPSSGIDFVSVTGDGAIDYIIEANGNGGALLDYDRDGDPDLLLVSGSTLERYPEGGGHPSLALFRNEGRWRFVDVTAASGVVAYGWGLGTCIGDIDDDGESDVYVTAWGPNRLYLRRPDGTFEEGAQQAGIDDQGWSHSCAFGDLDGDGDLDLYVTNYAEFDQQVVPPRGLRNPCAYRGNRAFCGPLGLTAQPDRLFWNQGDGSFEMDEGAVASVDPRYALGILLADLDGDGSLDAFVTNDSQPNYLYLNHDDGLEEAALLYGLALNERGEPQASMGIAAGDYDRDDDLDLYVTNFSEDYNTLYRNQGGGFFSDVTTLAGLEWTSRSELGWGTLFADLDADGWLDIYVANGHVFEDVESFGLGSTYLQSDQVLLGEPGGRFREVQAIVGGLPGGGSSRGLITGDLEADGDLDLVVINLNDRPTLRRNDGNHERRWFQVTFDPSTGCGRPGTRVEISAGGRRQVTQVTAGGSYLGESEPLVHFGLGESSKVDRLAVRCPDGRRLVLHDLGSRRRYRLPF